MTRTARCMKTTPMWEENTYETKCQTKMNNKCTGMTCTDDTNKTYGQITMNTCMKTMSKNTSIM